MQAQYIIMFQTILQHILIFFYFIYIFRFVHVDIPDMFDMFDMFLDWADKP